MKHSCAVRGCKGVGSTRHRFPNPKKDLERFKKWVAACDYSKLHTLEPDQIYNSYRVCHIHFHPEARASNMYLIKTAVPSLYLPNLIDASKDTNVINDEEISTMFQTASVHFTSLPSTSQSIEASTSATKSTYRKMSENLILGIDIGTTSVKVCVVDPLTNKVVAQISKDTQSNVPSDQGIDGNKQDVPRIISALNTCVAKLQKHLLIQIKKIGICGQMHGVMFWKGQKSWERVEKDQNLIRYNVIPENVSHLYTWQDSRCDSDFLAKLPIPQSHLQVYTGFGCSTIFWMAKNKPNKFVRFNRAGTIQDFAVAMLCNLDKPIMSDQNAASWGYFDCVSLKWNIETLTNSNFPIALLPEVRKSGEIAGYLADNWHSIPIGTPIGVALGDLQCSVLSTIENSNDAVLNVSTSAQIAFVESNFQPFSGPPDLANIEHIPYFRQQFLAVAASLNGGNSLATFVKMVQQWTMNLGFSVTQSKIWETVINLSLDDCNVSDLVIVPTCMGERRDPDCTASISNINIGNLELGKIFRALCHGLVVNLHRMMPKEVLQKANITRIVGNGSGLSRNKVLQKEVTQLYQVPLVFTSGSDAAKGAAMAMNINL